MNSNVALSNLVAIAVLTFVSVLAGCRCKVGYCPRPLTHSQHLAGDAYLADGFSQSHTGSSIIEIAGDPASSIDVEILTPELAAELAVLNHPALQTARAERGIACAQLLQSGILSNPQFSASFDVPSFGATTGAVTADAESITWDISQLRPLLARIRSAEADVDAVDMEILWQEWLFAQGARQAIFDLIALQNQQAALLEAENTLHENFKQVKTAFENNDLTIVDMSAAESAAITARNNRLAVEQEIKQQKVIVNRSLGRPPATPFEVAAELPLPDQLKLPSLSELVSMTDSRPDLEAIRRRYLSQEHALRAAVDAQVPNTSVGFTRASDTGGLGTLGAGITVDLQLFDRNQGNIATEYAIREQIARLYEQQVFTARSEVDSALANIRTLEKQIATAQQAIPVFEKLVETYDKAVRERDANVLVYYLAYNDLIQQRVELWRLRRELVDAQIALETAVGSVLD